MVGLGQIAMRGKEHIAALKPCGKGLLLETLHYEEEVRKADPFFAGISDEQADQDLLFVAEQLIQRKTAPFDASAFKDHYTKAPALADRPAAQGQGAEGGDGGRAPERRQRHRPHGGAEAEPRSAGGGAAKGRIKANDNEQARQSRVRVKTRSSAKAPIPRPPSRRQESRGEVDEPQQQARRREGAQDGLIHGAQGRRGAAGRIQPQARFQENRRARGKVAESQGFSFCIQKHAATRLHYDFRLELDGVLKSWAVTKGPSLNPAERRLAVHTEDHPLDYGGFEGTIPKGEYGGGTVMLWDRGTWEPLSDPHKGLEEGRLKFRLHASG
jgi:DNA ligase D-like protein (predicted 3'-phosphoesterase)